MTAGGWGQPPTGPDPGTNPWAVVSLVTGLLGVVPLAVVTGTVALVGLRSRPRRGQGAAVTGLIAAAVWTVLFTLGLALLASEPAWSGGALGRAADVPAPNVGVCLQQAGDQGDLARVVSCGDSHDAEVYAVVRLPAGAWPGYDTLDDRADDECGYDRYESYVGASYEESDYDYGWFASDEAEWQAGQREVLCVVLPDGLSRSVRGDGGYSDN